MNEFDSIYPFLEPYFKKLADGDGIPYREMPMTLEHHQLFHDDKFAELEKRFLRHLRGY